MMPPLTHRLQQGVESHHARDERHRDELIQTFSPNAKIDIARFQGPWRDDAGAAWLKPPCSPASGRR